MDMEQALQTFLAESRELLQEMEASLLVLESEPDNSEILNAIFRAAHTIKGSAGLFGLDAIVRFTHVVESVLDRVRDGKAAIDGDLIALLLECSDHIGDLVSVVAEQGGELSVAALQRDSALLLRLRPFQGGAGGPAAAAIGVPALQPIEVQSRGGGFVGSNAWHISLRFGRDVLRNGMDPLSFLRYLSTIGEIVSAVCLPDAIPPADEMDAESCYLGFEITFKSDADKAAIAAVFEFVREDCRIHILPPHSKVMEYIELIAMLPEGEQRLGDLLVASGALTRRELREGLETQESGKESGSARPLGEILVEKRSVGPAVVDAALEKQNQIRDNKAKENAYIRVQADKLDELINKVGELVIAGASASLLAQRAGESGLQEATSVISRLVDEIRGGALHLRMVPIGDTFNRFQRVVRDVSRELGKEIELLIDGADAELDKTVVEKIGDPLMHLVRNAMDHGIETAQARQAAGKPAKGKLHLNAYHDSGSIVIEIGDDGGGLNRERILKKAQESGIVGANQILSDQEVYKLIFEPGFSTAEQVTNLSGRGVGMDVVKRNITALRGTVELTSEEGQGTTVQVRLPLTLAIIDGFLVGVGKSSYVVPLDMVLECIELSESERRGALEHSYLNLRGQVLPFVRLREQFEVEGAAARRENVVVVHYAGQKAGLVVDELMGEFQTVIKPLGKLFSNLRGISGSTILGSGDVALILDVPSLVQQASTHEERQVSFR